MLKSRMVLEGSKSLFFFIFSLSLTVSANETPYPIIEDFSPRDSLFRQWQARLRQSYRQGLASPLLFFVYQVRKGDTFASISAKFNGWQETLASINRLSNSEDLSEGQWVLLSTQRGIFIYDPPIGELQKLMMASREVEKAREISLWWNGKKRRVYFFPFEKDKTAGSFKSSERFFFLDSSFSFPLQNFIVSSSFGWRSSPISGKKVYHKGIDLAASFGTLAYPSRSGKVLEVGYNEVYGNYVLLNHSNGYRSVYGHLRKVLVKKGDILEKTQAIGEVGDTGMSTGPHLHFEIYKKGELQNPSNILRSKK